MRRCRLCWIALFFSACFISLAHSGDAFEQARTDIQVLSSKPFAGRENGSDGSVLAQRYLRQRFADIGLSTLPSAPHYSHTFSLKKGLSLINGVNIVGSVVGRDTQQIIVITAHYDHIGRERGQLHLGADDNASGVAAMLFLAHHVAQAPLHHQVIFAATDAEEKGLFGARAIVEEGIVARHNVELNINLDMLARVGKPPRLYLSGEKTDERLLGLTQYLNQHMAALLDDPIKVLKQHRQPKRRETTQNRINYQRASDHAVFADYDIPYLFFGVGDHRDYHTPNDTADKIDFNAFNRVLSTVQALLKRADTVMYSSLAAPK